MVYECAVRTPLIMRWPAGLPADVRRDELVQWVDLAPTVLEATGAPQLPRGQGSSLLPLAQGSEEWDRDWALTEYRNSGHPYDPLVHTTMSRYADWKIIVHHVEGSRARGGELYDLTADPDELENLWHHKEHLQRRLGMTEKLLDVLVETEDRAEPREASF